MDYTIFWTAVSAIATSVACIIAIFLPIILYKIEHNKKLHIFVTSQIIYDITNNNKNDVLSVQISNIGNTPIEIQSIKLMIDNTCYEQLFIPQNEKTALDIVCYASSLPKKLDLADRIVINFSLNTLKTEFENTHQLSNTNKKIKIIVVDTLHKKYIKSTHKTLNFYIDKLYRKDVQK